MGKRNRSLLTLHRRKGLCFETKMLNITKIKMKRFEESFQKLEQLKSSERGQLKGGIVLISPIEDLATCEYGKGGGDKDNHGGTTIVINVFKCVSH